MSKVPEAATEFRGKAPPAYFTLHELLHAFTYCRLAPEMRRYSGYLYRLIRRPLREYAMTEDHLDNLGDMFPGRDFDGSMRSYARFLLAPFWHRISQFEDGSANDFNAFSVNLRFFSHYERLLRKNPPTGPGLESLHAEFLEELGLQREALSKILHEWVRKSLKA